MKLSEEKKKKVIYIGAGILVLLVLGYLLTPSLKLTERHPVLEKKETYSAEDFIKSFKGDVDKEAEFLDTETIGEHEFTYSVSNSFYTKKVVLR